MSIIKGNITIVFKTSNRSNAKTKIKTYRNKTIDDVLSAKKLVGIPDTAVILDVGMGKCFEEKYKQKYGL
jgi:plastocyanin domain-containing protein